MDSVIIKPTFSSLSFNSMSIKTKTFYPVHSSFVKFSQFSKFKTSSVISFSFKNTSNSENPGPKSNKNNSMNFPLSLLCIFFPILESIKGLASSHTQKWVSRLLAYNNELESILDLPKSNHYLKNGAFGVALLSVTSTAKVKISPFVTTLAANPTFVSGLFAWIVAQSAKMALNFFVERKLDFRFLFASGGMPSSHSALCTALTTSVALCHGAADCLFPVCLGFSSIVMYDAIGVRRHAGMQAEVLNMIVEDLFQGHPISQRKLKELLGHTPLQVFTGAVVGILVACICCQGCLA
ncbi:uncharacterized protein LOC123216959 isoform X1 [Mangifera indica]|uniref:uncharacterized protein LOC123216959 isoform X1 n=1 Tax=Mangifera indica TaxID=29780 RepID=UPI001CFA483B|nr:uncharacterized protein LOC123216959 isoform X1 [Mangifera indica]